MDQRTILNGSFLWRPKFLAASDWAVCARDHNQTGSEAHQTPSLLVRAMNGSAT